MAIGAEIPPTHPAPIRTGRIRAELVRGVDLTAASARHGRGAGVGLQGRVGGGTRVYPGVAVQSCGEARKGCRLAARVRRGGVGGGRGAGTVGWSLGHTQWSIQHSHSRAISAS
jgi:hypothetical protein